jgi:hypothetical protein
MTFWVSDYIALSASIESSCLAKVMSLFSLMKETKQVLSVTL